MNDWIEMDDRTSYRVNDDGTVTVSSTDDVDAHDTRLIAESLGHRLGGVWTMRLGEWSSAVGEDQVTSIWRCEGGGLLSKHTKERTT